ncbi:MAG: hypothetical protein ABIQ02_12325 [Saprospiraceae bacterium]
MILSLKKGFLVLSFSVVCLNIAFSQARFNLKTGVESWSIKDELDAGESHHNGQTIGFDMHLLSNRFIFAPGFHYHRISVLNKQEGLRYNFAKRNHLHYFGIPVTFGYEVFDLKAVNLSFLAGAESFFFYNLDSNDVGLKVDELFGVIPALTGVIQVQVLNVLTADIKYHHALHETIKKRPDSNMSGLSFEIGVIF